MGAADEPSGPASLVRPTVRRAAMSGRAFLIYGTGMLTFLSVVLSLSTNGMAYSVALPLFVPIFTVVGSMGALMVFTGDRLKGVLEYLIAYGVAPRRLFVNILLAGLVLVTVVLGVSLGLGFAIRAARGSPFPPALFNGLLLYGIPMSYVSAAFATTVGMFWTALSTPRESMSSPVGLAPLIGIVPSLITFGAIVALGVSGDITPTTYLETVVASMAAVAVVVVLLLGFSGSLLRRERLLSPT